MRSRLRNGRWLACLLSLLWPTAASAATLSGFEAYATIESIGLRVVVEGDDNGDAVAYAEIRTAGTTEFQRAHRLLPVGFETTGTLPAGLHVGSLLFLEPDTDYEVRVVLEDPDDPAPVEGPTVAVRTRAAVPTEAAGASIYVSASTGDDDNDGATPASAVRTVGHGVGLAVPGSTVLVAPGIYYEAPVVTVSGTPSEPIWIRSDGPGAVLDGSDPDLGAAVWSQQSGIWSTPYDFAGSKLYAAVDGRRLYGFESLADLQAEAFGLTEGVAVEGGQLYVKLGDGTSPAEHDFRLAREQRVLFDTVHDVVLEGFEIRFYWDAAVDLRDSGRCWILDGSLHHANGGVRMRLPGAIENVVQGNRIFDTSVVDWPWAAVKAHDAEGDGVGIAGGRGNVVRRNEIDGFFNGVAATGWPDFDPEIATETDITHNLIRNVGDDGFEPDGPAVNQRFVGNVMQRAFNALSLSPLNPGPVWIVRNVVSGYSQHFIKLNYLSDPPVPLRGWMLVYHNTAWPGSDEASAGATLIAPQAEFGHLVARNNIFAANDYVFQYGIGPNLLDPIDLDYDDYFSTHVADPTNPNIIKWGPDTRYQTVDEFAAATGYEQHGFGVEPSFEAPASGDYTLREGDPLLDVGVVIPGINAAWHVGGPDVGAIERGLGGGGIGGVGVGAAGAGADGAAPDSPLASSADDGGCGCRAAGRSSRDPRAWLALAGLGLGAVGRVLRRRGYRSSRPRARRGRRARQ